MKFSAAWLLVGILVAVLVFREASTAALVEQNSRYAAVIAAAANGGEFAVGEGWLVSCKGKKIAVY